MSLLAFLSRQARWALPAGVFVGILFPRLAELLRPLLTPAVIGTLTGALLRLDWSRFADLGRRPLLPAALAIWQLLLSPLLVWFGSAAAGLPPDLRLVLLLQAAAPPIGSAAVFALILGLDGVLAALATVTSTLLLPLTLTPLVALLLPQAGLQVDLLPFFLRVTLLVGVPFLLAAALRRLIGLERLRRGDALLGGTNVLLLVVFAIAVMDGVTERLFHEPALIGTLFLVACVAAVLLHLSAYLLFRRAGTKFAYTAAVLSGNRNMGLMLVITAGTAGEVFSLYVGLAQIPMYFAPLLLTPLLKLSRA
ncbi:MAG: Na+-dependent transporter [Lautropia sp.]|nr:Na+-dependent transporter [Lautropia sp.]